MSNSSRLEHFPISFFAMVMGLAGTSTAWKKAQHVLELNLNIDVALAVLTTLLFILLVVVYGLKLVKHKGAVTEEFHHPIKLNFFPAISISMLLLSICLLDLSPLFAQGLWMVGTALHLAFTLYVMNTWIHHSHYKLQHLNPAWFIPVVGNILVPITGTSLGYIEISWFFFSIGILFWIVLLTIFLYRVFFHDPLPARLMPTFFILIAPPAVGFIAYLKLVGDIDSFARILYYAGLFLTLLLLTQVKRFAKLEFFLSWWAYSFPMAAITIATFAMYERTHVAGFSTIATVLLGLLSVIIIYLLYRTMKAIGNKGICLPE
ncbi:MAG: C4-dicarboxylate ABC transporter [Gammaproteobacteria bacterium]|nr:C4-dicarboxylate ABC transporter [Gammaproteobacteria bacterium]